MIKTIFPCFVELMAVSKGLQKQTLLLHLN